MGSTNREDVKVHHNDGGLVLRAPVSTARPRANGANEAPTPTVSQWLTDKQCLNLCILSAILLGILYLFFGAFAMVFQNNHGFTIAQTGLSFLGE